MAKIQHSIIFASTVPVEGIASLCSKFSLQLRLGETLKIRTSAYTHSVKTTGQISTYTC